MKNILFILATITLVYNSFGQGYKIGDKIPNFSLQNIDEKNVTLDQFKTSKGVIVIFTCNHCPFAKMYEQRIIELTTAAKAKGYQLIAINPNDGEVEEDSFENMKKRAAEKKYNFPYLNDNTQQVAKAFGATRTPHAFLLQNQNGEFVLQYIGAIDDNAQDASKVKIKYIERAIDELNDGKPVSKPYIKAIGCTIKWKS
jgi:peroxiredoxin